MQKALSDPQKEVLRLAHNNRALFDLLPDMLFIIKDDFIIEHMNHAAIKRFGKKDGSSCHQVISGSGTPCDLDLCPLGCRDTEKNHGQVSERKLNDDFYVEYVHIPFQGYRQDRLFLLILRDITQKKKQKLELEKYSKNIEQVLKEKIAILRESEKEREQLSHELNHLKKETERLTSSDSQMLGDSKPIRELREMIYQVAASSATILITGESGTGKELVADLLYKHSDRADKPYLKFNCAAVTETLLESDLFGYEKGAFTGANAARKGKFEEADGGTIFLDEIGAISPRMQTALLRVLQDGEVIRVGSNHSISVEVRVIAATNSDLAAEVKAGRFREDLYYRLNVINLRQVPLRERKEDIVLLATNFLVKYRERFKKEVTYLPNSVVETLLAYDWPGNVRELENVIQRAVLMSKNGMITPGHLGIGLNGSPGKAGGSSSTPESTPFTSRSLKESVRLFEAEVIAGAVKEHDGKMDEVARQLGVSKTTLYDKLKLYNLTPKQLLKD
ncbi:transcriptional regulator with PAS, ATPase and Fis domain [Desulfosalsimonas propionicica]|uniref:Transcriptional regulator with PAS, ATPase and Fis domain n=1 Tax=Desulfosalsimonas propionicica TaxID=332175 RepID=A0A7W0CC69_9BACT|nr:sigma 54-interacting transcriptional regulator [Desulfosalsimonas propionicica]MBA2883020.1 transcriptional regulator with PAS, ATPase and Fis domain [Desulfosalsimonas propionicica]